jgi:hypothetical protein
MNNPIVNTPEYQLLLNQYKTNLMKYQPGINWYFENVEKGEEWNGTLITIEEMKRRADSVSPIGPEVHIDEVQNITPTWEWLCKTYPDENMFYDSDQYTQWIRNQKDAFFYSRGKEDFSTYESYLIAAKLGYRKVITENLS